jgi:hypothetical protein
MSQSRYALITVYSTSHALRAEKVLQRAGITSKLIPGPQRTSSDCSVCVRILLVDAEPARRALEAAGVGGEHIQNL